MPHPLLHVLGYTRPEPGPARAWLERELSRPEYRESLVDRFFGWLNELWLRLQDTALGASGLSVGAALVVLVVLVALVALVASRVRREPIGHLGVGTELVTGQVTPQEHRSAAESALAEGAFDLAIVEAFRALATRAVQRGVLEDRPGMTAHELAVDLGPAFPAHAEALVRSSALFDQVFYGDQPATAPGAREVLDLDDALRLARPGRGALEPASPTTAVPR